MTEASPLDQAPGMDPLRDSFNRNVRNCRRVILNDFEEVLADIILQFEQPALVDDRAMTALETAQIIAEAMSEGFSGLHPAGFEFACWLWEVAPLHQVTLPLHAGSAPVKGFRHGVLFLRRVASLLAGMYVSQQPQRSEMVIELLDSSIDWVDARNLVLYALVDHFERAFLDEQPLLSTLASGKKTWRRLLPLGTAARIIGNYPVESDQALSLVKLALPFLHEDSTYRAVLYVLRVAMLYGDQRAILSFFDMLRNSDIAQARKLFCESMSNPKQRWDRVPQESALALFRLWLREASPEMAPCLTFAIENLGHS